MKITKGFITTLDQAEIFFTRCEQRGAHTLEERLKIMEEMKAERRVFEQSAEQLAKRIHGKKVLQVKKHDK